jgi:penicillin amidase
VSISAPEVAKEIASVLSTLNNSEFSSMIVLLQNWNGDHKKIDMAPTVYYNMLSQIYYMSMKDEIGADALKSILATSVPKGSVSLFIKNANSPWWDDVRTKGTKETRSIIFEKAAHRTLSILKETCGDKPSQWTWGKVHSLKQKHALGAVKLLDKVFSVGPLSVDGGQEVLNNLDFALDTTGHFYVTDGPALRKVTDLSNIEGGETVSPSGQSGNVMSPFYSDQAVMFATGKTRKMLMNRKEIEKASRNRLVLKP